MDTTRVEASLESVTPLSLSVSRFRVGEQEYAVLTYPTEPHVLPEALTQVERQVLSAMVLGLGNRDIAARRGTSARTVANQVQSIFRKFGVHSRAELSARLAGRPIDRS